MSDPETLGVYAARAREYADLVKTASDDPMLRKFVAAVVPGGTALDIGCGPGLAAAAMARAGLEAHAWDPVPEMLALASSHPGVITRSASYADLAERGAFDGVWSNFSMLHTPLADWPGHLAAIRRALRPGGILHFGTKLGTGEARDGIGRMYAYVAEDALLEMLARAGFGAPARARRGEEAGLSGEVHPYIMLQARRA